MSTEVSRRERKKEETRERIFHAAIQTFGEKGFEAATIDEICERADVARGTFFNYFPRKDAVLGFLSEKRLIETEEHAAAIEAEPRPVRDKLVDIYANAASAYEEDRDLSRFVFLELMKRNFEPSEEAGQRWKALLLRLVQAGQASGELRSEADPVRTEEVLGMVYITTVYAWLCCTDQVFDLQSELRARLDLVLDGVVP